MWQQMRETLKFSMLGLLFINLLVLGVAPALGQDGEKTKVAVLDLEVVGVSKAEASAMSERLREEMLRSGRFILVDRSRLEAVIEEQSLQQTTCQGESCAVAVGRVLGVSQIVTGKANKIGSDVWQVSALLLDVNTAETIGAESVLHEGTFVDLLRTGIPELGRKLAAAAGGSPSAAVVAKDEKPAREEKPEKEPAKGSDDFKKVRIFLSPFTSMAMVANVGYTDAFGSYEINQTWTGTGITLGIEYRHSHTLMFFLHRHSGSLSEVAWAIDNAESSWNIKDSNWSGMGLGAAYVYPLESVNLLMGGGIISQQAYVAGDFVGLTNVETDISFSGLMGTFRVDYEFPSGLLLSAGLDLGVGSYSGLATNGSDYASGSVSRFYIPIGYAF